MEEKKNNYVAGLMPLPAVAGLALGARNAKNLIDSNTSILNPFTGGQANRMTMIGRDIASSTQELVNRSHKASQLLVSQGQAGFRKRFESMLAKKGPERQAIVAAYQTILNSPYLGLSKEDIESERMQLLSVMEKPDQEIVADISARIKKRMMEFGTDNQDEFFEVFQKEIQSQLKLEKTGMVGLPTLELSHPISSERMYRSEVLKETGELGDRLKKSLTELENIIGRNNYEIYKVHDTRLGATAWMAKVRSNHASFDVPIAVGRHTLGDGGKPISLPGGFIFQDTSNNGRFRSAVAIGSYLQSYTGAPIAAEDYFLQQLKGAVKRAGGAHSAQRKQIEQEFAAQTWDTGQRIAQNFNDAQRANLILSTYSVTNKIPGFMPGKMDSEQKLITNPHLQTLGVGYSQLATGQRFLKGAPLPELYSPGSGLNDLSVTAKSSSLRKTNLITTPEIVINSTLGWTDKSFINMRGTTPQERTLMNLNRGARRVRKVVYQFDSPEAAFNKYNLGNWGEGAYLGRTMSYYGTPTPIKGLRSDQGTELLRNILTSKEKEIVIGVDELKKHAGLLGRTETGNVSRISLDPSVRQVRFRVLPGNNDNLINLSYEVEREGGRYSKVRGHTVKGQVLNTPEKILIEEAAKAHGISVNSYINRYGEDGSGIIVGDADQVMRQPMFLRNQMLSSFQDTASHYTSKENVVELASQLRRGMEVYPGKDTRLAGSIAHILLDLGASPEEIAGVVAGQYRVWKEQYRGTLDGVPLEDWREEAGFFNEFWNIGSGNQTNKQKEVLRALRNAKSFYGLDTISLDTGAEFQGAGKMASIERRTLHSLYQSLRSSGLSEQDATKTLGNIISRTGNARSWKHLYTSQSFLVSAMSMQGLDRLSDLEHLGQRLGVGFTMSKRSLSSITNVNLSTEDWFRNSTMVKFKFDNKSGDVAKKVFGTDEIMIPGLQGVPSLHTISTKKGGQKVNIGLEYQSSLEKLLKLSQDPNAEVEQIQEEMYNMKSLVYKLSSESSLSRITGKVAGSTTGRAWMLNKVQNPKAYNRMMEIAAKDNYQTVFMSDRSFFTNITSHKQFLLKTGAEKKDIESEITSLTKKWLFESTKENSGIYGFGGRHPSLGEGHATPMVARRVLDRSQNQDILKSRSVKEFLEKNFGGSDNNILNKFLRNKIGTEEQKREFSSLIASQAGRRSKMGDATFYVPTHEINYKLNGNDQVLKYNPFTRAYADFDGDVLSFIMANNDTTNAIRQNIKNGQVTSNFLEGNIEFDAIKRHIKTYQNSKVFDGPVNLNDHMLNDLMKMVHSKNVQKFSTALDALKVGVLGKGGDAIKNKRSMQVLTVLEEIMLKAKKQSVALNIADDVAEAVFKGDKDKFFSILREHVLPENQGVIDLEYHTAHASNPSTIKIDMNDTLEYIWDNYTTLKAEGGMDLKNIKAIVNNIDFNGLSHKTTKKLNGLIRDLYHGKGGLIQGMLAEEAGVIEKTSLAAVADTSKTLLNRVRNIVTDRRVIGPAAIGIGATLALSNFMNKDLQPEIIDVEHQPRNNVEINPAIRENFLESQPQQPYQYVDRGNVIQQETYADEGSQRIESTFTGINNLQPVKNIINTLGMNRNQIYIQDNRRPITKNTIDQIREQ